MKYTKNYRFKKPEPNDTRNINDINDSFDLVDAKLKETQDKNTNLDETFKQLVIDKGNNNAEIVAARRDKFNNKTYNSVPDRLDDFSGKLAQTATKTELQQVSLSYKESYSTLDLLKAAYPNGNVYNHTVLSDGMIYTYKNGWVSTGIQANGTGIPDEIVTPIKLDRPYVEEITETITTKLFNLTVDTIPYITVDGSNYIVSSKNMLFLKDQTVTSGGITATVHDGIISINGTASEAVIYLYNDTVYPIIPNLQYTFKRNLSLFSGVSMSLKDENAVTLFGDSSGYLASTKVLSNSGIKGITLYIPSGTYNNMELKPMLYVGVKNDYEFVFKKAELPRILNGNAKISTFNDMQVLSKTDMDITYKGDSLQRIDERIAPLEEFNEETKPIIKELQDINISHSDNLIDKELISLGYINTNTGSVIGSTSWWCTGFIDVTNELSYYHNGLRDVMFAFFDENRNYIPYTEYKNGTTLDNPFIPPARAKYFRGSLQNFTTTNKTPMLSTKQITEIVDYYYQFGKKWRVNEENFNKGVVRLEHLNDELKEKLDILREEYNISIGDSLTMGVNGDAVSYTQTLRNMTGKKFYNMGVGGETSTTICTRMGAMNMLVNNITIPASTTRVQISGVGTGIATDDPRFKASPIRQVDKGVNPVRIAGIEGTLTIEQSSVSSNDHIYYFTRSVAGEEKKITVPTAIITKAMRDYNKPNVAIIFMGTNGGWSDASTDWSNAESSVIDLIAQYKKMIDAMHTDKYLILGLIDGSSNDANRKEIDKVYLKHFGRHFINIRRLLVDYGLAELDITPTTEDLENISVGRIPRSLRLDSVHHTIATDGLIGKFIYQRGQELGYWE